MNFAVFYHHISGVSQIKCDKRDKKLEIYDFIDLERDQDFSDLTDWKFLIEETNKIEEFFKNDIKFWTPSFRNEGVSDLHEDRAFISCTPEDAFQSTATVQLAMISYNTGTIVRWDNENKQIINNSEASEQLQRAYRGSYLRP